MTTFADAVDGWCAYRARLVALGLVRDTTARNQKQIAGALKTALGDIALDALRKSHAEIHVGERLRVCKPVTVAAELNVLRQILNWCLDESMLAKKPRLPTVKVPNVEVPLPPDATFLWVLRRLPERHGRALEFMMLTGLAPHELERMRAGDVVGRELLVGLRKDFQVKQESRRRRVPLNDRAWHLWAQAAMGTSPDARLFPSVAAMDKAIQRLRLAPRAGDVPEGLGLVTPKLMRKWFASKVAETQPEHVVQRLLGHAPGSKVTRKHYVRSSDSQLAGAVEELGA